VAWRAGAQQGSAVTALNQHAFYIRLSIKTIIIFDVIRSAPMATIIGAAIGVFYGLVRGPKLFSRIREEASRDGVRSVRVSA
jgi:hypothetical protein